MFRTSFFGAALVLASLSTASAHITLQEQQAPVGGSYRAVFRVPHGCSGSATVAVKVRIPDGFIDVKPMPKAGWKQADRLRPLDDLVRRQSAGCLLR